MKEATRFLAILTLFLLSICAIGHGCAISRIQERLVKLEAKP